MVLINMNKIKTPHAAILIWNYVDRITSEDTDINMVHQVEPRILSTVSCLSISTVKNKSEPNGRFEIVLAPTKNWTTVLSPGSWLAILMTQEKIKEKDFTKADPKKVKMFGRIESVRVNVNVDQATGARSTNYIVSGVDWGSIFNTTIYIDPLLKSQDPDSFWSTWTLLYSDLMLSIEDVDREIPLFTSDQNMDILMKVWGQDPEIVKHAEKELGTNIKLKAAARYVFPAPVAQFFGFPRQNVLDNITQCFGAIRRTGTKSDDGDIFYDRYLKFIDAVGLIAPDSIYGTHSIWQLLNDNCNSALNELVTDMRWDENGKAQLALYKRVRPFIFRENFDKGDPTQINSEGKEYTARLRDELIVKIYDVRSVRIPINDILSVNAGTNWRDKSNFVEMRNDIDLSQMHNHAVKYDAQSYDEVAFSREGFRPLMPSTKYFELSSDNSINPIGIIPWKYLWREWHFNSHVLLNGTITFMGQNNYIQVGDNIMFEERAISASNNTNIDSLTKKRNTPYILAHVESISHNFTVSPDGARSFVTTVSFVRGIVVDADRKPLKSNAMVSVRADGRLDKKTTTIPPVRDRNTKNIFGSSSNNDPDPDKLRGH